MNDTRVNGARLWESLMEMAKIGALPAGGCCRLALTDEDIAGRALFKQWCEAEGCTFSSDDMGNLFVRRSGRNNSLDPIVAGSHLDTQPHGGKFDGIYGVLAGLEVIRTLNENNIETEAPVEVVVWMNEEGARFAPAMIASGVYANLFTREFALGREDLDGVTQGEALEKSGFVGNEKCGEHKMGAYLEAHIEQGPILEINENVVGVVTGGQGSLWYDARVTGTDSHAGSTPMKGRRDAFIAASKMTLAVHDIVNKHAPNAVGTIGSVEVKPNSRNTIAGEVFFTIDIRHPDYDILRNMDAEMRAALDAICTEQNVELDLDEIWDNPPAVFSERCITAVRDAARDLGCAHQDIVSGAGHDACQVSRVVPVGMIFVPCAGGISHNEAESAEPDHLEAGCNVLLHAMISLASRA
ncbi:MAG: Zn-dependent hydrolase [Pseudomonadota bacterium]